MPPRKAEKQSAFVTLAVLPDGTVHVTATGQNGSLTLQISGDAPTLAIPDPARGPQKYKGVWGLQANGHLKGWLVDEDDRISWFPERAKPTRRKKRSLMRGRKGSGQ